MQEIIICDGCRHEDRVRELFAEYTGMLCRETPDAEGCLRFQGCDEETAHPAGKYAPPGGRLYLALAGEQAAGCAALHGLEDGCCELKRLYVRPEFRGRGLAGRLLRRAVEAAAGIGYTDMVLDTFPFLETAIGLYRRHGFVTVPPHNDNPTPGLVYMRLHLADFC